MASNDPGPGGAFPITFRSILIGALGMALIALVHPYLAYVRGTWEIGFGSLLSGVVLLLFLLVAANGLLARLTPGRELTRTELLVAYAMMIIAGHLIHCGGLPFMVGATTYPIYRATPSNGWEQIIWPHIPLQLRLNNPAAVTWFWEGLPQGTGMPWGPWLTPMAYWGAFTVALAAAMFCLGALLSKDWVEAQRLTYPLVEVPLAVVGEESRPTILRTLFRNRIFLIGFALPAAVAVLSFLHAIYPNVPAAQLYNIRFGPYFQGMGLPWTVFSGHWDLRISIIFSVIGITCLLPSEVSLSLWLFYVIYRVQQLVWASFGVADEGGTTAIAISPREFIGFMEGGGVPCAECDHPLAVTARTTSRLAESRWTGRPGARSLWTTAEAMEPSGVHRGQRVHVLVGYARGRVVVGLRVAVGHILRGAPRVRSSGCRGWGHVHGYGRFP